MNILAALFEVMDKEPPLLQVWILFLTLGIGGFLLCRYRRWMLAVVLPLLFFFISIHLMELHDPFVGPAIVSEAGQSYVTQSYLVMALAVSLPFLGIAMSRKRLP
ncbi:MAG TPA: hypothetical protein VM911_14120 [Pyrinomonadaceae bacterium]|jgi:uncharacterized membrane protein|nr:hypothetical protein [Pyrinomonadaceae bacterium]